MHCLPPPGPSQAASHVGFPAVIKPIHGAASLGVLRVDSKESLSAAYDKVTRVARVHAWRGLWVVGGTEWGAPLRSRVVDWSWRPWGRTQARAAACPHRVGFHWRRKRLPGGRPPRHWTARSQNWHGCRRCTLMRSKRGG